MALKLRNLLQEELESLQFLAKIIPYHQLNKKNFHLKNVKGIIFSGGPNSVDEKYAPKVPKFIYDLKIPILGICYGLQLICKNFGGKISYSKEREFGKFFFENKKKSLLFGNKFKTNRDYQVWMSHSDAVKQLPSGFKVLHQVTTVSLLQFKM